MKGGYFGYIRVSTTKQGEQGSSLAEQKSAITAYAHRNGFAISTWFEEQETAAATGRKQFTEMLRRVRRGEAMGIILHKIDRGARNLKDWAELAALMDAGIQVYFAHESLDLSTRGGRLTADIQAVVSADFIRNLRDEVKKGMYGRLKQGLYPWRAPVGYLNNGGGKPKTIDPVQGALVRRAFNLYASGEYSMKKLLATMTEEGLRGVQGERITLNGLSTMLENPFYYGLIVVKGAAYQGIHEPLIDAHLFERARAVATGRTALRIPTKPRPAYLLQRMLSCAACSRTLYPERQKGIVYFRCHSESCRGTSVRESAVLEEITRKLRLLKLSGVNLQTLTDMFSRSYGQVSEASKSSKQLLQLRLGQVDLKLGRLTDALLEDVLTQDEYAERKKLLMKERLGLSQSLAHEDEHETTFKRRQARFLELTERLYLLNISNIPADTRQILRLAVSNIAIHQKEPVITWSKAYQTLLEVGQMFYGEPAHEASRIVYQDKRSQLDEKFSELVRAIYEDSSLDSFTAVSQDDTYTTRVDKNALIRCPHEHQSG